MTPREKARQLIETFNHIDKYYYDESFKDTDLGKQCALIAVDEIIKLEPYNRKFRLFEKAKFYDQTQYWQEVKKEIEKL